MKLISSSLTLIALACNLDSTRPATEPDAAGTTRARRYVRIARKPR